MKKKIGSNFRHSPAYLAGQAIKECLQKIIKEIKGRDNPKQGIVYLSPAGISKGKVLFSYIIDGFLLNSGEPIPKTHTNIWQSVKMAETFVELGYEVEVIHYHNHEFVPDGKYSFFLDVRNNLQRLAPLLNNDCVKIMHIDSANILFHNAAEAKRHLDLQQRKGITLQPRRFEMPNKAIENADFATTCGNDFTISTFAYAKKKIFRLPSPCGISLPFPNKDFNAVRKNFLWFSSSGPVHKGLDLALDAFKQMPDFHLTICGPVEKDKDFIREYRKELYETKNIHLVGWVDVDSEHFKDIAASCVAALHLSCSEGGAPSVKMCMHAGLIPIISRESGVDVDNFGFVLEECTLPNIKQVIRYISSLPNSTLEEKGCQSWEHARLNYTRDNFSMVFRKVLLEIEEEAGLKKYVK